MTAFKKLQYVGQLMPQLQYKEINSQFFPNYQSLIFCHFHTEIVTFFFNLGKFETFTPEVHFENQRHRH